MNRINDTTRQSELNNIRKELKQLKTNIANLALVIDKVVRYEAKEQPTPIWRANESINAIINGLSESMDVLLDQMLRTQNQIIDANTITITRKLKKRNVNVEIDNLNSSVKVSFDIEPQNSGSLTLLINNDIKLELFINFKRRVVHTDNSKFEVKFDGNDLIVSIVDDTNANTCAISSVSIGDNSSVDLHKNYEFEQDAFLSFCVQYLNDADERFFPTLIQSVQEVEN